MARSKRPAADPSCAVCSDIAESESRVPGAAGGGGDGRLRNGLSLGAAALAALAAAAMEAGVAGFSADRPVTLGLFLLAYLLAGGTVVLGAVRHVLAGRPFDELFLMTISTLGAFLIGHPEEAVGVMIFYRIGEMVQDSAAEKSRRSIHAVLALRPDTARVSRDGSFEVVRPESVEVGESIRVLPGERVPLDGIVTEGEGWLDASSLTGESTPRRALAGAEVLTGAIVNEGALTVRVSRPAGQSYAARIVDLVENASHAKARQERFITRFARWYTPAVVGAAAVVALLPPLVVPGQELSVWVYRALVMLVVACPCALVLSVPLGYFAGLGGAARRGILVKGSGPFDTLAKTRAVVFDKTGTLTLGDFVVRSVLPAPGRSAEEVLALVAEAEEGSNHPIAAAIRRAAALPGDSRVPAPGAAYREIPGKGVIAERGGQRITAGTKDFLASEGVAASPESEAPAGATTVYAAKNGEYLGLILLGDTVKPDAAQAIRTLREEGIHRLVLLTGDARGPAGSVALDLGIPEVYSGLLPHEKLQKLETILAQEAAWKGATLFVGDGVNDAPVLARADVGIAMGDGADAALETADVVLMTGEVGRVAEAIRRARFTRSIVRQNIAFALLFKLAFLALGAAGVANMWEALVADVGVALLAVLNSTRALRGESRRPSRPRVRALFPWGKGRDGVDGDPS